MDRSGGRRRKTLKERLGFDGRISCCGATWGLTPSTISSSSSSSGVTDDDQSPLPLHQARDLENNSDSGMNLATALAAERDFRAGLHIDGPEMSPTRPNNNNGAPGTPFRVSLMRLLEESDGAEEKGQGTTACCVCMGREKGAAFIPCGHTFCRVCSRELWLNRGCCPLCNRPILDILDIF